VAAEHYAARRDAARAEIAAMESRSWVISMLRLFTFALSVALGVLAHWRDWGAGAWVGAVIAFAAFVVLFVVHDGVLQRKAHFERVRAWAEEGIARIEDRLPQTKRPNEPSAPDDHAYADDLDVFGSRSLMQSLDTTRTREGRARLASWLAAPAESVAEIHARQDAARALSDRIEFCEALCVEGARLAEDPEDIAPLVKWIESKDAPRIGTGLRVIAIALPLTTILLLAFGSHLPLPRLAWLAPLVATVLLGTLHRSWVAPAIVAASAHQPALARFEKMFGTIEAQTFRAGSLRDLHATLAGARASSRSLARIVGFVDARRNEVFRFILGPLLGWDLSCAIALERWRATSGGRLRRDLDALARLEALVALGTRAFERPNDAWPDIVEDKNSMLFHAEKLGHPLIPASKVVRNDVAVGGDASSVLLVTGSNMSGKSTLLRAVGANVVLALAGAPVRASSMRCSPFAVHTSMRVRDSLSEGVSHFFAELQRLKQVVDAADAATKSDDARPVLFLLDEILHGTNSRERHLGARAIVRHLAASKACGLVSTHDLALAALEQEIQKVRNVHFREQVARDASGKETMTFDYALLPGVVTSSNALRLMRIVGIDVPIPEESSEEAEKGAS
jgi:hypothetical protein